ncbi:hypothetical protein NZNM25_07920 [Nitrosopumilus zosterae]|uniref:Uncharacterized protein n=1 Tax=Nitrosopumilus zosterae TaxID=718286 RepID=A0A2S2KR35_9ARCH|nr:hypothetical protein NZNM25_07920 [Nitrosopumilus zosterae]
MTIFTIGILGLVGTAFAIPPFSSQEVFDFSDTIVVGKVILINSTFSPTHNLYHIQVEKFLKNPHDSDVVLAAGQNITSSRSGTQIFHVGDRALFFLTAVFGYGQYHNMLSIHPTTKLVESDWDKCNIFENNIPSDHWMLGGTGSLPKISQDETLDINAFQDRNNFKVGKTVTVSYDISNISDRPKEIDLDGILSRSNGAEFEAMSTMSQHVVLEPCTVYKTIEWRFTPGMTGSYLFEINNNSGTSYGLGFAVKESVESPLAQLKPSGVMGHVQTSSTSYVVGDEVFVRIDTKPNSDVVVDVLNPSDKITEHFVAISDEYGQINTSFLLPHDAMQGTWKVKATYGSDFETLEFDVKERLVPEPEQSRQVSENCGPGTTLQDGICVVDETKENHVDSDRWGGLVPWMIESPLKQIKKGIEPWEVKCNDGLIRIFKSWDLHTPACVFPDSIPKLNERGWQTLEDEK